MTHDRELQTSSENSGASAWLLVGRDLARLHHKLDRIGFHLTRLMLHSMPSTGSGTRSRSRAAKVSWLGRILGYGRPVLSWIAERIIPLLLPYIVPIAVAVWAAVWAISRKGFSWLVGFWP